MNISRSELYRLVIEEYLLSEGAGNDAAEELLKQIMGDKYKPPEERDPARYAKHHGDTEPMEKPHDAPSDETADMPMPDENETHAFHGASPEERPALGADELAATIGELIHGRDPEEVSEIFQMAFEKLPGVELSSPGDEDYPGEETLYSPGAEGRPTAGFQLQELLSLIQEVMGEGDYHDFGGEDEVYDVRSAGVSTHSLIQRLEGAYHNLMDAFEEIEDETNKALADQIISNLETLMDVTEHPEDYRE
jgi:hypothetical protein